jgi:myb proto-oncogene protein
LFNTHNVVGNKWAKISALLPGRTDNYIKNHFYSTLRKAVRRVNNFLSDYKDR